jgi:putative DNA primase/helicase
MSNDIERIREALQFIDASDRETWLRMGMAIKSELADTGFDVWEAWGQQADSFNAKDARDVWKSIRAGGKVTLGTLIHEAKANGWRDDGSYQKPTPEELEKRRQAAVDRENREKLEIARERADTAKKAAAILKVATEAKTDHPYLSRKGVSPVATLREIDAGAAAAILGYAPKSGGDLLTGRLLVVPVKQGEGLSTLELIDGDKRKAALAGRGSKVGGYWATERLPDGNGAGLTLLIGEGVATVLSAKEATGHPAIAALSSGNLPAVAKAMRERYPAAALVILADLVKATGAPDPHAIEAARAVGGLLAIPEFSEDRAPGMTDFNDMAVMHGRESVRLAIANATHQADGAGAPTVDNTRPEPLPTLPDVLPFDYDYLPGGLRPFVRDISERMQCPPDFAAVGVFVMMATIIGRKVGIRPMRHNDWLVICNQWGAVVGNSGVMKSPTLSASLSPIKRLQQWAFDEFNSKMADYGAQEELAKLQKTVAKSEAKKKLAKDKTADVVAILKAEGGEEPPILKRFMTNNASYEALGELLMENPNGLLVESDEIIGLLKQLDAGGQEVARSFYLTAADGDKSYTFDRIIRGKGLHIPALCLCIIGGIQPGVLAEYVRQATGGGAGADGLLQRFGLMVYPDISPNWKEVDRYPDGGARNEMNALAERLDNLRPESIGAEIDQFEAVPFLRFDDAAQALFSKWRGDLEMRLRSGEEHPSIVSHLSKYRKLIPSLALINHLCDGGQGAVSAIALARAIAFSEYLESHARRIYSYATRPDIDAAKTLLKKLSMGKLATPFKARDIYRAGWTGLETPEKAQAAISLLQEYRHLSEEEIPSGGAGGRATRQFRWVHEVEA